MVVLDDLSRCIGDWKKLWEETIDRVGKSAVIEGITGEILNGGESERLDLKVE